MALDLVPGSEISPWRLGSPFRNGVLGATDDDKFMQEKARSGLPIFGGLFGLV